MLTARIQTELYTTFPSIRALADPLLDELCAEAGEFSAPAGHVIQQSGEYCRGIILLTSGTIRISRQKAHGRSVLLYRLRAGEYCVLAACGVLAHRPVTATGTVEDDARGAMIPAAFFRRMIAESEVFRDDIQAAISRTLLGTVDLVEELAFEKLERRLARRLVSSTLLAATHQQIAEDLGSAREVITRLLNNFEDHGWITLRRAEIRVADEAALRRLYQTNA